MTQEQLVAYALKGAYAELEYWENERDRLYANGKDVSPDMDAVNNIIHSIKKDIEEIEQMNTKQ